MSEKPILPKQQGIYTVVVTGLVAWGAPSISRLSRKHPISSSVCQFLTCLLAQDPEFPRTQRRIFFPHPSRVTGHNRVSKLCAAWCTVQSLIDTGKKKMSPVKTEVTGDRNMPDYDEHQGSGKAGKN